MPFGPNTQARKVTDFLATGKTITAAQAERKFGVKNLRAVITTIADRVEAYGNHQVYVTETARGATAYGLSSF